MCFFKPQTAYDVRISDWSSDVCSSDLTHLRTVLDIALEQDIAGGRGLAKEGALVVGKGRPRKAEDHGLHGPAGYSVPRNETSLARDLELAAHRFRLVGAPGVDAQAIDGVAVDGRLLDRSEEHTSELQSL